MKRSKLCFGLLLALAIMLGLSSSVYLEDTNALSHDYVGIPFLVPCLESNAGYTSLIPYSSSDRCRSLSPSFGFGINFQGSAYDSSLSDIFPKYSSSFLGFSADEDSFYFDNPSPNSLRPLFARHVSDTDISAFFNAPSYALPEFVSDSLSYNNFHSRIPFGYSGKPSFDNNAQSVISCGPITGAVCGGLWNASEYLNDQILPYWYTADGFYRSNSAIDTDSGIHYSYTFSFDDLFNVPIRKFSSLTVPLHDYGGYFWDSSNLTRGRQFEFKGAFEFEGSFNWNSDINNNGSVFEIAAYALPVGSSNGPQLFDFSQCVTNLVTLPSSGYKQLEFSCSGTLASDYVYFLPYLFISGGSTNGQLQYVFETDNVWRFASMFLVTDNDDTPGSAFNSTLTGGGTVIGSEDYILGANTSFSEDWFASLTSLFSFDFINPFAPIFNLFNNDSCAQIPTLAGMLHSQETEICPWFDSSVRNIVTPVLGLSSMMLVFGFVVRWLGSRSGNFIEDSGGVDINENYHFGNKFRRKK